MPKIDVHQHFWTPQLLDALAQRRELPFVRIENGLTVLYLAGERPYVLDLAGESLGRRSELVRRDGLDRALVCLSSPLGIEGLARAEASALIDAHLDGALALDEPFAVWGAIALKHADPDDVDRALERGCVGLSLPAGALGCVAGVTALRPVLDRLESHGAPLLVHPGPGRRATGSASAREWALSDPLWWPAMTDYVSGMQSAWLAFVFAGRPSHPGLRVVFAMLAGLAPLQSERLRARGGASLEPDPLTFYDTSSYGPESIAALAARVGFEQLLHGSDRPVVDPSSSRAPLEWEALAVAGGRLLARSPDTSAHVPAPELVASA
jgi:6-methylsalicylate decarboxylase